MLRPAVLLSALAVLATGCGHSAAKTVDASKASKLVLAKDDLPSVFAQFYDGPQVALDTQGTPRADATRFGRERGWIARYHRPGGRTTPGPLVVETRADVFRDEGGAKSDLGAYERQFSAYSKPLRLPRIGDADLGATIVQPGPLHVRSYLIAWRDRNVTASVNVNGFGDRMPLGDAIALARKQERRIAAQ